MTSDKFRLRACAAIVRDAHLLLVVSDEPGVGVHYNLPGGGVRYGEAITDAVRREVLEETGFEVEVGRFLLTFESLHEHDLVPGTLYHSFGLVFECHLEDGAEPKSPTELDSFQTGVEWVPLDRLAEILLLPYLGAEVAAALRAEPDALRFCRHTTPVRLLKDQIGVGGENTA